MSTDLPIQMLDMRGGRKSTGKTPKKFVRSDYANVGVYMPKELKARLGSLARADRRSLSNFIVQSLKEVVEKLSIDEHGVIVEHISKSSK